MTPSSFSGIYKKKIRAVFYGQGGYRLSIKWPGHRTKSFFQQAFKKALGELDTKKTWVFLQNRLVSRFFWSRGFIL